MPAAPDASAVAAWLHRSTAQTFGDFPSFSLRMKINVGSGEVGEKSAIPDPVHLVTSSHFATYRSGLERPQEFVLESARTMVSKDRDRDTYPDAVYARIDQLDMSTRLANCLERAGLEFIYQVVEMTGQNFYRFVHTKTQGFGNKTARELEGILRQNGLSFGMKFPSGFSRQFESRR